ncbi:MAG: 50S ribosomal protein L13 [Desulfurococcales archaeon]|nr:50S ribosomal protein L13 [Desulfurococcales archaeon]
MRGEERELVVDGSGMILGRLASIVAKKLLEGYRIHVVNAEKIVVSGDPVKLKQFYKRTILGVKSHYSHRLRPKRPRSPTRLFKHAVRGMLPKGNKRGREALKRLRVYIGVPSELSGKEMVSFKDASSERLAGKYIELGVIARELGWRVES